MSVLDRKRIFETGVWVEHQIETYLEHGQNIPQAKSSIVEHGRNIPRARSKPSSSTVETYFESTVETNFENGRNIP